MKKLLITCSIVVLYIGLSSTARANPTTSQTGSQQPDLLTASTSTVESDDSDFFLEDWLQWLFEHLFGWDWGKHQKAYVSGDEGSNYDSGDDDWNDDPGDDGSGYDPGSGGSGDDPGNGGSGNDPGSGGSGGDTDPVQSIPAPGAVVLGAIGSSFVCWLRRRRIL